MSVYLLAAVWERLDTSARWGLRSFQRKTNG